jgi:uncharacterized integral membrane protein (TIGR00698 family)
MFGGSSARSAPLSFVARLLPGLILAAAIGALGLAAESLEQAFLRHAVIEALVAAILIGIVVRNLIRLPSQVDAGASYAAKQVLELAVCLLGATVDLRQVLAAGPLLLLAITLGVVGGIGVSFTIGRALGLHSKLAVLVAVGNSVCGNSAIAAVAPVIRADKKDVASSIALTAVIGVVLVLSLPLTVGLTVYAVPQVVAASFSVSQLSGQVGTLVKLVRVLFIGPVVLFFSLLSRRMEPGAVGAKRPALVPWFIVGFVVLAALRFLGLIPTPEAQAAGLASRLLTILAMAGLGLGVEFAAVRRVGPRVALAVCGSLAFLIALSLTLITQLHIAG